jgi:hypothetical protein
LANALEDEALAQQAATAWLRLEPENQALLDLQRQWQSSD